MLGQLVADFISNTSGFTKPIAGARSSLKGFVSDVKGGIASISEAFAPLAAIALPIAGAFAFKEVVDSALAAEAAGKKFQAVLDATGGAAGLTKEQMQEFAGELQKTTNFEDDATTAAAAMLASFTNIRGDVFKGAVKSAMDLSAVMGMELPEAMRGIGMALNDPINGMMRLSRLGVRLTAEQQEQVKNLQQQGKLTEAQGVILGALQGKFGGAAQAMASPFTQIKNIIGDISENIGFAILPTLKQIVGVVTDWVAPIQGATSWFKEFGEAVAIAGSNIAATTKELLSGMLSEALPAFDGLGAKITEVFANIPFAIRNFGDLFKIAGIDMELAIIDAVPGMEQAFKGFGATVIGLWDGIGAGWDALRSNIVGGIGEIKNLFSAVVAGASAAFSAISSGNVTGAGGAFADAFVKELAGQKDENAARNPFAEFGAAFDKSRKNALAGFAQGGGLGEGLRAERDRLLEEIDKREVARLKPKGAPGAPGELPGVAKSIDRAAGAEIFGSKESISSIFSAMRAGQKTGQDKANDLLEQQLQVQERQETLLKNIEANGLDIDLIAGAV